MKITLKLFATLSDHLPPGAVANAVEIDVPETVTLNQLIDQHQVPRHLAHLVLVNGHYRGEGERDRSDDIKAGDTVSIWPPVAGG